MDTQARSLVLPLSVEDAQHRAVVNSIRAIAAEYPVRVCAVWHTAQG